jgi:hypothetical protein
MIYDPSDHDIATSRGLLTEAFTAQDLRRFCQDRPIFSPSSAASALVMASMIWSNR